MTVSDRGYDSGWNDSLQTTLMSRITISRLMIRLRQTGRTNDRPRNGMPRVTSQRQDTHLRLRMITAEDTARGTPGLANVQI